MTEPYYQDDHVTIYHGDCLELAPTLHYDAIITDPPYGLNDRWAGGGGEHTASSWRFDPQEAQSWDHTTVDAATRLFVDAPVAVVWGGNYYDLPPARGWFVWDKKQPDTWTTGQAELAWTTVDRPVRVYRMSQVEAHTGMHKQHPTQKPVALMRWCIEMARLPVDAVILDPFAGSGTTLRAAKDLGRKAVGIELDERYCEIAARRMGQEVLAL